MCKLEYLLNANEAYNRFNNNYEDDLKRDRFAVFAARFPVYSVAFHQFTRICGSTDRPQPQKYGNAFGRTAEQREQHSTRNPHALRDLSGKQTSTCIYYVDLGHTHKQTRQFTTTAIDPYIYIILIGAFLTFK